MAPETRAALGLILGPPSAQARIVITDSARLASAVWAARPAGLAILPFDQLDQRWKLIHLDGINLFERTANLATYPLILRVGALGDPALARAFGPPQTNRDPARMAVVAMTGVTALVRGTAIRMDEKGQTYPGAKIRDWLRGADIAHISNEVSFMDKCPAPDWNEGTVFCSTPKRLELLKDVGTDVIELTGNHLWDRGWENLSTTLGLYRDLGWATFGGGRTYSEALIPLTMTVNGNRIAFVGCNYFGANWATDTIPGSARCGRDSPYQFDLITPTIKALAAQGYLVIATIQYAEFYEYKPRPGQIVDFEQLRAAGAMVVNGSQGHHVQGFSVTPRGFIHYGTGNLFFGDQEGAGTHQTFVDRHVFYNGRYLGADLRAAYIENEAQPVPMTPAAKAALLKTLFAVSGYEP
jgi:poly-gamma-glutamate synthesis protein (capsule biosynthesis protein)